MIKRLIDRLFKRVPVRTFSDTDRLVLFTLEARRFQEQILRHSLYNKPEIPTRYIPGSNIPI